MGLFIGVYVAAIALALLTTGWAWSLGSRSGRRLHRAFFFYVLVNDLVGLADLLFRLLPGRAASEPGSAGPSASGFIVFPLLAAFSVITLEFLGELAGRPLARPWRLALAGYWALFFLGFLSAEVLRFGRSDARLVSLLQPVFNVSIVLSGLGGSLWAFLSAARISDARERGFVRAVGAYLFVAFAAFGWLFYGPLRLDPDTRVAARALLGQAYLLVPLAWMGARARAAGAVPLTRLAEDGALDRWLEAGDLSPREREIVRRVLEGRRNSEIGKELFIGRRTVESHLYSAYRKLGVRSRLQLARRAAAGAGPTDRP